jgi:hypothetical protein
MSAADGSVPGRHGRTAADRPVPGRHGRTAVDGPIAQGGTA